VHYIVSTDAIGMGLNLDIHHLALGSIAKFDGTHHRPLSPAELGQIAGRAGRYKRDGAFSITAACAEKTGGLDSTMIEAVESQRFAPVRRVRYRNSDLDFSDPDELLASLLAAPPRRLLVPLRDATDQRTLEYLLSEPDIRARVRGSDSLELLWEVCRVPDFRRVLVSQHAQLIRQIFTQLQDHGRLDEDWLEQRLRRLDRTGGGAEVLMSRIAFIRTWTFVANREDWLPDRERWRGRTREIEDRLSDALHEALTQRFVDQRSVVLMDRFDGGLPLKAELTDEGELKAAGVRLGSLEGFRFEAAGDASGHGLKLVLRAARQSLTVPLAERVAEALAAPNTALELMEDGRLCRDGAELARLTAGASLWKPAVRSPRHELLSTAQREALQVRGLQWVRDELAALSAPLEGEGLSPPARGLLYQLREHLGSAPREQVRPAVEALSSADRKALHRLGVRLGVHAIYSQPLLKPAQLRRRAWLWSVANKQSPLLPAPSGAASIPATGSDDFYAAVGYRRLGARAVRLDMVERLDAHLRAATRKGTAELPGEVMSWLGCRRDDFISCCRELSYIIDESAEPVSIRRPRRSRR
ncbi:MAG: ATP-dependent RNA helicase SUPV3L1/SUV3, partial [Myxococcota bacterium]